MSLADPAEPGLPLTDPAWLPEALPPALKAALRQSGAIAPKDFPGGQELLQRLQVPRPAPPVWMRLAHALNGGPLRGKPHPEAHWCQAFLEVLALAWVGLSEDQRRAHGLYPQALRCAGELQHTEWLDQQVTLHAQAWRAGEQPAAALVLLRMLKRLQRLQACQALVEHLGTWLASVPAGQVDPPMADWPAELAGGIAAVARGAESLDTLHWAQAWLPRLLPKLLARLAETPPPAAADPDAPPPHWLLHRDLAVIALCTLDLPVLRQLSELLCRRPQLPTICVPMLVDMLGRLAQFDAAQDAEALLALAASRLPRHPVLALERAKRALLDGLDELALSPFFEPMDPGLPGYHAACSWFASQLAQAGAEALAMDWYRRIEAVAPLSSLDQLRLAQLQARHDPNTQAAPESPLFDEGVTPVLQQALAGLVTLLGEDPFHNPALSREAWASRCAASLPAFAQVLAALPPQPVGDVLVAVRQLRLLERAHASAAMWQQSFPFEFEPAYGRVDPLRYLALQEALCGHLVALADHVLRGPAPLHGGGGRLRQLIELLRLRCEGALSQDRPADALASVNRLAERIGTMAEAYLQALRERCALAEGDLATAAELRAGLRWGREAELQRLRPWPAWLAAEGAAEQRVLEAPAVPGHFESVRADGVVQRFPHATVATRLSLVALRELRVRNSYLLIAREGGMLLPEPWHLSMGDYPYEHLQVLNRGRLACSLQPSGETRRITEPVLVLANLDATYHRNYYHWMVLILSRVRWLQAEGWLDRRPLLMPRELSGWMRSSLQDIGVRPEQLVEYADGETLQLADALLLSPLEYACRPLMDDLCRHLWRAAGLDPDRPPAPQRLLYISRLSAHRRPLVHEETIMAQAKALGFELLAPETLSLLEQVRLFANARGIAGPPGAAYTNLSWCQPGTRVLSIFKEEVNLPTFVDISVQRGQQHRWLLGHNLPGFDRTRVVAAPFSVSLELTQRELAWVAGA